MSMLVARPIVIVVPGLVLVMPVADRPLSVVVVIVARIDMRAVLCCLFLS